MATNQRKGICILLFLGLLAVPSLACGAATLPQYEIIDLGTLGGETSIAYDMNEQGAVAGKSENPDGSMKAFYWDPVSGMSEIGPGKALGINDLGRVVGNLHHHTDDAFIWDDINGISVLNKGDFLFATANGIGNSGKAVGYAREYNDVDGTQAILWDPEKDTLTILESFSGPTYASAINSLEEVVGNWGDPSRAFIWNRADGMKDLGTLNEEGWRYYATGINDDGQVVGYVRTVSDEYHAFIWDRELGMRLLSGDGESLALSVNRHGHAVGAQNSLIGLEGTAYLWKDGQRVDLNKTIPVDSGWELREARGITDEGRICGTGLFNGHLHAFLLTPILSVKADIKANGSDSPITLSPADVVSITVTLDPCSRNGENADWWIAAKISESDWYSYVYPTGWVKGIQLCLQAPLSSLPPFEILRTRLPLGNYIFYFAVDDNADGAVNATWWDSVSVNVE